MGCNARGLAWYELLPRDRRDWGRMNDFLTNPPARRLRLAGVLKFCLEHSCMPVRLDRDKPATSGRVQPTRADVSGVGYYVRG
jgi:hypothetical protein